MFSRLGIMQEGQGHMWLRPWVRGTPGGKLPLWPDPRTLVHVAQQGHIRSLNLLPCLRCPVSAHGCVSQQINIDSRSSVGQKLDEETLHVISLLINFLNKYQAEDWPQGFAHARQAVSCWMRIKNNQTKAKAETAEAVTQAGRSPLLSASLAEWLVFWWRQGLWGLWCFSP